MRAGSHHISAAGYANCAGRGGGEFRTRHEGVPRGERQEDPGGPRSGFLRQARLVHRAARRVREQGSTERSQLAQGPSVARRVEEGAQAARPDLHLSGTKARPARFESSERRRGRGAEPARAGARPVRWDGRPPREKPRGRVRWIADARTRGIPDAAIGHTETRGCEEGTRTDEGRSSGGHKTSRGPAEPQGSRPRPCARGPASVRGNRHDIPLEKRGRGDAPEDDCGDPRGPRESKDRPNGRRPTVTGPTGVHLGRFGVVVLAAFAIGLLVIVVSVMEGNGPIWPYAPILAGSWVIVMLIIRAVVRYKIYTSALRKQREIVRQEISRLEARIDDVQRKSGDKN